MEGTRKSNFSFFLSCMTILSDYYARIAKGQMLGRYSSFIGINKVLFETCCRSVRKKAIIFPFLILSIFYFQYYDVRVYIYIYNRLEV